MMQPKQQLERLISELIAAAGLTLWGIQFLRQGSVLRVYIGQDTGLPVDDCAMISRQISALLDAEDTVDGHYVLAVSSPGLGRLCPERWQTSTGQSLPVELFTPHSGRRKFKGVLLEVDANNALPQEGCAAIFHLPLDQVKHANIMA